MRNFFLLIFILAFSHISTQAQISYGGNPLSLNNSQLSEKIPLVMLPPIDLLALLEEDGIDLKANDIPLRFGIDIPVSYNLLNSGTWETLEKGNRVWRLKIKSESAYSLNFIIQNFYLAKGAKLFFINENGAFLGSFTHENNTVEKEFATSPLNGDIVTIELFEPYNTKGTSTLEIAYVIHAYRDIFGMAKDFGQSGSCNINVNCPQGSAWQNQKRSVAMILTANNTRICTGALVNNVRQDGTPYFLTANHCLSGSTSNTWIFMFNYESPACTNVNGPTNQTVQGSVIRAKDAPSDFALLELTTPPPPSYNVYFSGWSAQDIAADSCVGIHHPNGDIKKITFDYDTVVSSGYSGAGNDHWRILSWNAGTTEGGSSGSPLYDKSKRIIGQLHGGSASCNNPTGYDVYGKFSYSWNTATTPDKRLKDWLDPDGTGILILDGSDFNTPQHAVDAAISQINSPSAANQCQLQITPEIVIKNNGANVLISLDIYYVLNASAPQSLNWTGTLNYFEQVVVTLPTLQLSTGQQHLLIYVSNPNSTNDENNSNDTLEVNFSALIGNEIILNLTTDNYPEETSWKLLDSTGAIIYSSLNLSAQTTYAETFCLSNGCYDFVISDTYGDGMAGGWWPPSPPGTYSIVFNGDTLDSGSGNFGFADTIHFCVNEAGIAKKHISNFINIYPNPAQDFISIEIDNFSEPFYLELYAINGQLLRTATLSHNKSMINVSALAEGIYYMAIYNTRIKRIEKIILVK